MMRVGAEDRETGQSNGLLAASCCQGSLYGTKSSDFCGILVGLHRSSLVVLEKLISLEVKLLIGNSRHAI
jgi:hypothetical protein